MSPFCYVHIPPPPPSHTLHISLTPHDLARHYAPTNSRPVNELTYFGLRKRATGAFPFLYSRARTIPRKKKTAANRLLAAAHSIFRNQTQIVSIS